MTYGRTAIPTVRHVKGIAKERRGKMPKVKPTPDERSNRVIVGIIEKHMRIEAMNDDVLARKIGVSVGTVRNWKNNPEPMPICKVRLICKVLHIPNWEKVSMI